MEGKPSSVPDVFDTRRAKGSINFRYYELTELLALIDGEADIDRELIRAVRRKITKKARAIEKRFERPKGDADGSVEDAG